MILVTGATGNVGRHVVTQLLAQGIPVRALTRNPLKAQLPAGAELIRGDLAEPESLVPALDGVTSVFLFAVPRSAPGFLAAAKLKGVRRVVFMSSNSVRDNVAQQDDPIATFHAEIEQAIEASDLEWTIIRPGAFATNALQWARSIRAAGSVSLPFGEGSGVPIHEADIASVAVHSLTSNAHIGAKYAITGPESLTQTEQVKILGDVLQRSLRFEELSPEEAHAQMLQYMPPPIVDALFKIWARSVGKPAFVSDKVQQITGKPPRTFREWALDHIVDFQ